LIQHESLICKDCFEVDTDWSSAETNSGINDLKMSYYFNIGIKENEFKMLGGEPTFGANGHANLLCILCLLWIEELEYKMAKLINIHVFAVLGTLCRQMS